MAFPGPDLFLFFYMKRRIERGGKLQWYEAPYCCEENPPAEWFILEKIAHVFEQENKGKIQDVMMEQMESARVLNYRNYVKLIRSFINKLPGRDEKVIRMLAVVVFTGVFARRIAELDVMQRSCENWHDYRREIYQVAIYGSRILFNTMSDVWTSFYKNKSKYGICVVRVTAAQLVAALCTMLGVGAALYFFFF